MQGLPYFANFYVFSLIINRLSLENFIVFILAYLIGASVKILLQQW